MSGVGGQYWSRIYVQGYIDFLKDGGKLFIQPHVTTELLYQLLEKVPVYININANTAYNVGHKNYPNRAKRESMDDDINGSVGTHSVVVYGNDEAGNFLIADPWDGLTVLDPETLLCSVSAANIECDSQLMIINR